MNRTKDLCTGQNTWELSHIFDLNEFNKYRGKYTNEYYLHLYKTKSQDKKNDYEKLMWQSKNQMLCRFSQAANFIDFSKVNSWLDLGCGTGDFFKYVLDNVDNQIKEIVGVDLTQDFLYTSKEKLKDYAVQKEFIKNDITSFDLGRQFDLITVSGIIQCMDVLQLPLLMSQISMHSSDKTQFWLDTINYYYRNTRRFFIVWIYKESEIKALFEHYYFREVQTVDFSITQKKDNKPGYFIGCYGVK